VDSFASFAFIFTQYVCVKVDAMQLRMIRDPYISW